MKSTTIKCKKKINFGKFDLTQLLSLSINSVVNICLLLDQFLLSRPIQNIFGNIQTLAVDQATSSASDHRHPDVDSIICFIHLKHVSRHRDTQLQVTKTNLHIFVEFESNHKK